LLREALAVAVVVAEVVFVVVVEAVGHPLPRPVALLPKLGDREGMEVPEGLSENSSELEGTGDVERRGESDALALALREVEGKLVWEKEGERVALKVGRALPDTDNEGVPDKDEETLTLGVPEELALPLLFDRVPLPVTDLVTPLAITVLDGEEVPPLPPLVVAEAEVRMEEVALGVMEGDRVEVLLLEALGVSVRVPGATLGVLLRVLETVVLEVGDFVGREVFVKVEEAVLVRLEVEVGVGVFERVGVFEAAPERVKEEEGVEEGERKAEWVGMGEGRGA
jgi:hypothetical protein